MFSPENISLFMQVLVVDLLLAADNAIIVGLVAARVPADMRQKVIFWGIGAAVVMRIVFSLMAVQLLKITGLLLVGGLLLIWVCWRLWKELREDYANVSEHDTSEEQFTSMRPAILQIVIADLTMSIDNVVAVAGIARNNSVILVIGLALSVAFMVFAATFIAKLLQKYPWIAYLGLAFIFYVGMQMIYEGCLELLPIIQAVI